jgi:hypothetical protein
MSRWRRQLNRRHARNRSYLHFLARSIEAEYGPLIEDAIRSVPVLPRLLQGIGVIKWMP